MWVCDRNSFSAMVGCNAVDDTKDWVMVSGRIIKSFQNESDHTVTTAITIRSVIVGFTGSCLRQELTLGKPRKDVRIRQDIHTASENGITVSSSQGIASQVNGCKTTRTCGIDTERGTTKAEVVVDSAGPESSDTTGNLLALAIARSKYN